MKASEVISQVSQATSYQATAKANTAKASNFQDYMESNMQSKQENNAVKADSKPTPTSKDKTNTNVNTTSDKNTSNNNRVSNEKSNDVSKTSSTTKNPIEDKMNQLATEIKETVMESLQITENQLDDIMSVLGLNYLQLLEPSNLASVFMQANGITDPSQILTNEMMSDQFNQLVEQIGQIDLEDMGLTKEDVATYLEKFNDTLSNNSDVKETVVTNTVTNAVTNMSVNKANENQQEVKTVGNDQQNASVNFSVQVEKATDESDSTNTEEQKQQQSQPSVEDANATTILNNLSKATTIESFGDELVQVQQMRDIANQVIEQVKVVIKPSQTSMEMQLNPESLGKVNLLVTQKEGVLTAQFTVQNEIAKEALESQMQTLKDNFVQQGIKVEAVEVTVSNLPFSQDNMSKESNDQQKPFNKRKNINLADLNSLEEELTQDDQVIVDMMNQNGNSVDYSA